jgi:hypothetical protein
MQNLVLIVGLALGSLQPISTGRTVAEAAAQRHSTVVTKTDRARRNRLLFQWDRRDQPKVSIPRR